jgi:hypothetical protein
MINYANIVLNENEKNETIFYKATDYVLEKELEAGFDELDEIEKYLFMVGKILMEVNNGGFDQYFFNTDGIYARETLQFLKLIDEIKISNLLFKAISIFDTDKSDDEKYDEFNGLDKEFYELSSTDYEDFYNKCICYIRERVK